jgi:hypothetical protein
MLALASSRDDAKMTSLALARLAFVARQVGDYDEAVRLADESLPRSRRSPLFLEDLVWATRIQGDSARAVRLLAAAEAARDRGTWRRQRAEQEMHDYEVAMLQDTLGESASAVAWAEGSAMTLDEAAEYALDETAP